jgi:hypothetical protein
MRTRCRAALAGATALAAFAAATAPAHAAPDRSIAFGEASGSHTYQSEIGTGIALTAEMAEAIPCDAPGHTCDETLITMSDKGKLTVAVTPDTDTVVDVDLHLFPANEAGEVTGPELAGSTAFTAHETISRTNLAPGTYLVRVNWSSGVGSVTSKASFVPAPKPPPAA